MEGQTQCVACDPGTFSASEGVAQCLPCDVGSWSSVSGSTSCTPCALGYFQANTFGFIKFSRKPSASTQQMYNRHIDKADHFPESDDNIGRRPSYPADAENFMPLVEEYCNNCVFCNICNIC